MLPIDLIECLWMVDRFHIHVQAWIRVLDAMQKFVAKMDKYTWMWLSVVHIATFLVGRKVIVQKLVEKVF